MKEVKCFGESPFGSSARYDLQRVIVKRGRVWDFFVPVFFREEVETIELGAPLSEAQEQARLHNKQGSHDKWLFKPVPAPLGRKVIHD